ncbi:hypothetical protein A1O1_04603 [Capronia coronata CBS 617.96]|uniref:DASH complex subunit DUO1 n=1 Tax=Capronia coronata CBS 617.96 TaxID=1182541 RepID=W9YZF1_9EURO|nr:uncharacterized protein A1O1_04603 [Capronia coronata CBS 617.96]EXJ87679.1 hypothetical protein A1O1_04603 [Capronia coronata CBS 617.96]
MDAGESHNHEAKMEISLDSPTKSSQVSTKYPDSARPTYEAQSAREEALRHELESVRQVNDAIEGVLQSLGRAKENMMSVNNTVNAASALLNTWTRILSQTEHNQRLILDPAWQGASQDIADIEEETLKKQRAADRREVEEQERRLAAARQVEAEEKRKAETHTKQAKVPSRGGSRIGTTTRGTKASTSSYVQMGGSGTNTASAVKRGTSSTRRSTSGIGRGIAGRGSRGRG